MPVKSRHNAPCVRAAPREPGSTRDILVVAQEQIQQLRLDDQSATRQTLDLIEIGRPTRPTAPQFKRTIDAGDFGCCSSSS
jgi:hypothetical protein